MSDFEQDNMVAILLFLCLSLASRLCLSAPSIEHLPRSSRICRTIAAYLFAAAAASVVYCDLQKNSIFIRLHQPEWLHNFAVTVEAAGQTLRHYLFGLRRTRGQPIRTKYSYAGLQRGSMDLANLFEQSQLQSGHQVNETPSNWAQSVVMSMGLPLWVYLVCMAVPFCLFRGYRLSMLWKAISTPTAITQPDGTTSILTTSQRNDRVDTNDRQLIPQSSVQEENHRFLDLIDRLRSDISKSMMGPMNSYDAVVKNAEVVRDLLVSFHEANRNNRFEQLKQYMADLDTLVLTALADYDQKMKTTAAARDNLNFTGGGNATSLADADSPSSATTVTQDQYNSSTSLETPASE